MCSLIFFSLLQAICQNIKIASQRKRPLIEKNSISKEKAGTFAKVKLVTKIKKHNQLYIGTLVLLLWRQHIKYELLSKHCLQRKQQHGA